MALLVDVRRLVNVNKSFDSVHHNILSDKLIKYKLGKWALKWSGNCLNWQAQMIVNSVLGRR